MRAAALFRQAPLRAGARARPSSLLPARCVGQLRFHCDEVLPADAPTVSLEFVGGKGGAAAGTGAVVRAVVGSSVLATARAAGVDLEGACECSLACSTCHVVLPAALHASLPPASDEEEDLLDLAFGLTPTSRLGCQVKITAAFEGAQIRLPMATRNLYVDGHVPKPH